MAVPILRMKILPDLGVRMIDGEISMGTVPLGKTVHHLSPPDILGLGVCDMNLWKLMKELVQASEVMQGSTTMMSRPISTRGRLIKGIIIREWLIWYKISQ